MDPYYNEFRDLRTHGAFGRLPGRLRPEPDAMKRLMP